MIVADLVATFLFALQGGATAAAAGLDVFGILVVAFVVALGGGVVRDVLIGDVPPAAFRSTIYPVVAFVGGAAAALLYGVVREIPPLTLGSLDAAGLALFAVVGAAKAPDHGMNPLLAALLGTLSAVGGGVPRDILLGHVPAGAEQPGLRGRRARGRGNDGRAPAAACAESGRARRGPRRLPRAALARTLERLAAPPDSLTPRGLAQLAVTRTPTHA